MCKLCKRLSLCSIILRTMSIYVYLVETCMTLSRDVPAVVEQQSYDSSELKMYLDRVFWHIVSYDMRVFGPSLLIDYHQWLNYSGCMLK